MRAWAQRTAEVQRELAAIAKVDPGWWLFAAGVAFAETRASPEQYLACDAEPDADTFMGYRAQPPRDLVRDAINRALAARTALRELDGAFPDQPLAVAIERARVAPSKLGLAAFAIDRARVVASKLDVAAFAIGSRCLVAKLDEPTLATQLAAVLAGAVPPAWHGATPFVCVSIGDEPIETARHGHRRAWSDRGGPWLGLGRTANLAIVSTCHLIVDGYAHARITARIAELASADGGLRQTAPSPASVDSGLRQTAPSLATVAGGLRQTAPSLAPVDGGLRQTAPSLAPVDGAVPLAIAWRELASPTPRVIPLAYHLGQILHRSVGQPDARFSPTIQIPVARGSKDDPLRLRRRVVAATTSVRFEHGVAEPFAAFDARVREVFAREARASGLVSRLLAAARAVPVPLAWKRKSISAKRPRWLESLADVIGGRALLSRIALDSPAPATCAVSSPSRLASDTDPIGGCVITIVDNASHAAITVCGSGFAGTTASATALRDELLAPRQRDLLRLGT